MHTRTMAMSILVASLGLAGLASCTQDTTDSSGDSGGSGICQTTIEFRGQFYRQYRTSSDLGPPPVPGRKLGKARTRGCANQDADGPAEELTIYAVTGTPPREAVFAKPHVGLMRVDKDEPQP